MEIKDFLGSGEVGKEIVKQTGDLVKEPVANIVNPPTNVVGRGIAAIVSLVFNPIIYLSDKQQVKYLHNLEIYKQELNSKISAIPDENYVEPNLQIAAQALEDSKYCIAEPNLRELFVNLIASASDSRKADIVHPSFSAILKQMSPRDAVVMQRIKQISVKYGGRVPIANIKCKLPENKGNTTLVKNVIIPDVFNVTQLLRQDSISSLVAFGLIDIDYINHMAMDDFYKHFDMFAEVAGYKTQAEHLNSTIEIGKGICELTVYGKNFAYSCGI